MDVDFANIKIHANRFSCGLGCVIRIGKTKYMQTGSAVVLVVSYIWEKQSIFCGLWSILMVPDVIEDASYVVSLLLSVYYFGHHVRIIVSGFAVCC